MGKLTPWESLDERANCAINEARLLLAKRRVLIHDLAANYRRTFDAMQQAIEGLRRQEASLSGNCKIWFSAIGAASESTRTPTPGGNFQTRPIAFSDQATAFSDHVGTRIIRQAGSTVSV